MRSSALRIGVTSGPRGEAPHFREGVAANCAALRRAGAFPVVVRSDEYDARGVAALRLQGLVFTGGGDISAARYGGNEHLAHQHVNVQRDAFELSLIKAALRDGLPVLAICRGMQLANVALGGSLIEDLRHELGERYRVPHQQLKDAELPYGRCAHHVNIARETMLHSIAGSTRIAVNSVHHQAIGKLGRALRVSARADDGVIEAIERTGEHEAFFLGLQWHPEWLADDLVAIRVYARFTTACTDARRLREM